MSKIAVMGAGLVGGTAVALTTKGHRATRVDMDAGKVDKITRGKAPFCEQGLDRALASLTNSFSEALKGADACIIQAAWSEFTRLGTKHFSRMASPWPKGNVPKGIRYRGIGQG